MSKRSAVIKRKVGTGACFACGREVVWRKTDGGAFSCTCQHCDFQGYAKHGTEAEQRIMAKIGALEPSATGAKPEPAPAAAPAAPAPAAPKPKTGAFGLAGF